MAAAAALEVDPGRSDMLGPCCWCSNDVLSFTSELFVSPCDDRGGVNLDTGLELLIPPAELLGVDELPEATDDGVDDGCCCCSG